MRKLLFAATCLLAVALSAGLSYARFADAPTNAAPRLAPAGQAGANVVDVPAAVPPRDATHAESYGYRPSEAIARRMQRAEAAASGGASAAPVGGGTVVVTAFVLPVRTIVVDSATGLVTEIWSNTTDRHARDSMYMVREDSLAGATRNLDAAIWKQVGSLLARSNRATGRIA